VIVLGYVRVSSTEQEQGFGQEVQANAIRAYCAEQALSPPEIVYESVSAESIVARIELKALLRRAKDAGAEAHVVFYRLDRLARNLSDQEMVVGHSMTNGYRLHSTYAAESETLNPAYAGDPMRVLVRQVFGIFAQFERATIQGRMDTGLMEKAKVGGSTGGRLPFGYLSQDRDIAVDTACIPIVQLVFGLAKEGLTLSAIAAYLARQFPERCAAWDKGTISRMLSKRNLYQYGRYRSRLGVVEFDRPELCMVLPDQVLAPPPSRVGPISWERFEDPLPILVLSLLLDKPVPWIQRAITDQGIAIKWIKGRMYIAHSHAQLLERIAKPTTFDGVKTAT
jgi:site-specific DNA recombinase